MFWSKARCCNNNRLKMAEYQYSGERCNIGIISRVCREARY